MATRWLTADQQRTWRAFLDATQLVFATVDDELQRDADLPHTYYEVLVRLSEAPNRALRMSQLAVASLSSKSRISHAVARLEERGWVRRMECASDRRGQIAQLTEDGYAALAAAAPGHVRCVRTVLFDALTDGQAASLREICEAIRERLSDEAAGSAG